MSSTSSTKKKSGMMLSSASPPTKMKKELWQPDDSYKLSLKEIRDQLTPSGLYRHKLTTTAAEERFLRRLEWRWERRLEKWTRSATIVKAGFRGMKTRRFVRSIRHKLEMERQQRNAKTEAVASFAKGGRQDVLDIIATVNEMNGELWIVRAKVHYTMGELDQSFNAAQEALQWKEWELDSRYIMACIHVKRDNLPAAYEQLTILGVLGDQRLNTRRLRGYVAVRMTPPDFSDGIDAMSRVVDDFPEDLNMRLHRALTRCCGNDFSGAVSDFTVILGYQPSLDLVQYLRARAYCCMRQWKLAQQDYETILSRLPDDPGTLQGLEEITTPILELPMLDESATDA